MNAKEVIDKFWRNVKSESMPLTHRLAIVVLEEVNRRAGLDYFQDVNGAHRIAIEQVLEELRK